MEPGQSLLDTEDSESGVFENGIMAGDLDSLLEMFEEAESVLSSSVGCISLTRNNTGNDPEGKPDHPDPTVYSESDLPLELSVKTGTSSVEEIQTHIITESSAEIVSQISSHNEDLNMVSMDGSVCTNLSPEDRVVLENVCGEGPSSSCGDLQEPTSNDINECELRSHTSVHGCDIKAPEGSKLGGLDSDTPESSIKDAGRLHQEYSETSSEYDNEFSFEEKGSDSSSSPSPQSAWRGRAPATRRDGPRRQQGRGRTKPVEEEKLYDRLPSYYTVFSRPNRTATGLIRSSRSCIKLVMDSETRNFENEPSTSKCNDVFDKVPSYQSCFTNSTRYDEVDYFDVFGEEYSDLIDQGSRYGRGHGSRSSYECSRQRFRSRSRLRVVSSPRHRRSGRTFCQNEVTVTDKNSRIATSKGQGSGEFSLETPEETNQPENKLKQEDRRILYIGRIPLTMTAERLKELFECFGRIEKCTVHFRECGDNYGFVTYTLTSDSYRAVEEGTSIPGCQNFDICFGGRRKFCRANYYDHDGNVEMQEELAPQRPNPGCNFDDLLMDALLQRKRQ